ncbi:NAD(P)/FAD-dependent oxidoreductase [Nonomuraea sp. NPDC050556]|uniref:NAD(P)/FAD-dependent oxidoreductase n=1 Tax=Nonomuraea sp. NPDC050556 TaxID=3364369 RepID=UPI00379BD71D
MTRAVVLGGGFAGVLAATVLARHVDEVVVVEGDRYPAGPGPRRGLPQSHHSHVLVAGGARALERLLPGTLQALYAGGAQLRGLPGDALILAGEGWFHRLDTEAYLISCSRGLLDHVVRERARVQVRTGTRALGLTGDADRVTGVVLDPSDKIEADLVVDATGRRSKARAWLAELGGPEIEEVTVSSGLAYSTRVYRAPLSEIPAVMLHPRPARGATVFPIEGDRWIVTLTGTRGAEPPATVAGFEEFARSLPDPIVADLMAAATPLGGVRPYRDTANRRRYYERARLPSGFVVIGDAAVAVNPVYSHGMSVAALGAERLDRELARGGTDLQSAMAEEAELSWRMATRQDAGGGPATPFQQQVRTRVSRAALSSPELAERMFRAQTLLEAGEPDGEAMFRAMTGDQDPLLTAEEAIGQYPALSRVAAAGGAIHR